MEIPAIRALILVAFLLCSGWQRPVGGNYIDDSMSLQSYLFTNYSAIVRPDNKVYVTLVPVPLSLNTLDISQQMMSFTTIFLISWFDIRLMWSSALFGNIEDIIMPAESVWTPSLVVENAISNVGRIGGAFQDNTPLRIQYWGGVKWYPPLETSTSCEMKIYKYPFDIQTCYIIVSSWGMSSDELVLDIQQANFTYFSPNGEWDMLSYWTSVGAFYDGSHYFKRVFMHFKFQRRWQFYGQNLLMPIVLTSILMSFVFALPIESGEKMGYALTVLLSYVVFLTWVTDNLPAISNDTSILQMYLAVVLCLGVLATLLTCWVLHLYHREPTYPMSRVMRFFVMRCLIFLRGCNCCCREKPLQNKVNGFDGFESLPPLPIVDQLNSDSKNSGPIKRTRLPKPNIESVSNAVMRKNSAWSPPKREPDVPEEKEDITWQEVASLFDRLFLIVYLVLMSGISVTVIALLYDDYE